MPEEIIKVPSALYKPNGNGSLGIITNGSITWYTCREQFQTYSQTIKSFLFHCPNTVEDVIEFIRTVEQAARVSNENAIVFHKTNDKNIIHVTMSAWWSYRVRRSLLTALLRCGMYYTQHTGPGFEKALWSQPYTKSTKYAVERFLSGYTASRLKKKHGFGGWQALFAYNTQKQAEDLLVRVKKRKPTTIEMTGELSPEAAQE